MRFLFAAAFAALLLPGCVRAQNVGPDAGYSRTNVFSVFANYSNDSSHMIIGQEQNRKFAGLGVAYSRRMAHKRSFDFMYEAEVRPLTFVRDPVVSGTSHVVVHGEFPGDKDVPFDGHFSGPTMKNCTSGSTTTDVVTPAGVSYTQTITQKCGSRWTYAGGISPLGLRFNFATRHRVQPFLVANGGFLVAPRDVPVNYSANFNFTFEWGAGVEFFSDHRRSWAVDYRFHHLSNANSGYYNPGIDSGMFRMAYRFGR